MYLVECKDTSGKLYNLTPGTVFPTLTPSPSLTAGFDSIQDAYSFVRGVDPRTWEGEIVQASGIRCTLRRSTLRIARLTVQLATVAEVL